MRVTLDDLIERINDDIATVRAELEEIREEAGETDDPDEYDELEEEARDVQDLIRNLEADREKVRRKAEEWDGDAFRLEDLTWGDRQAIDDAVRAKTVQADLDDTTAMVGAYQIEYVNRVVSSTPPGAPSAAGDYPEVIGDWLYNRASEYNSGGEVDDMGNGSPLGDIPRPDGQPSSSGTE